MLGKWFMFITFVIEDDIMKALSWEDGANHHAPEEIALYRSPGS